MHTPQRPNGDIFNRMVSGAAYMPDAECAAQTKRIHAATVLAEEHYARGEQAQAMHVYREHLGHLGEHSHIRPGARFDYGVNTYIGDGSFFNFGCVFLDVCPIRIGSTVLVGNNVQFSPPPTRSTRSTAPHTGKVASPSPLKTTSGSVAAPSSWAV